jgi:hypothetical protein
VGGSRATNGILAPETAASSWRLSRYYVLYRKESHRRLWAPAPAVLPMYVPWRSSGSTISPADFNGRVQHKAYGLMAAGPLHSEIIILPLRDSQGHGRGIYLHVFNVPMDVYA